MKTYVIAPKDQRISKQVRNVWVVNEFKHKGYNTKKKFLNIVHLCCPELNNAEDIKQLNLFWLFRSVKHVDQLEELVTKL